MSQTTLVGRTSGELRRRLRWRGTSAVVISPPLGQRSAAKSVRVGVAEDPMPARPAASAAIGPGRACAIHRITTCWSGSNSMWNEVEP